MFSRMGADGYHGARPSANSAKIPVDLDRTGPEATLLRRLTMRASFLPLLFVAVAVLGCASDESIVCERLDECGLMPDGLSDADCEDQAVVQVPEDRLERCAECVDDTDCKNLVEKCGTFCEPGD